jgi:hypothetical protein
MMKRRGDTSQDVSEMIRPKAKHENKTARLSR